MKPTYAFLLLFLPVMCLGQISIGISAGTNTGKFGGVEPRDASYASRTGVNFGGTLAYRIDEDISLLLQPMYSQRGSNIEVGEDTWRDSLKTYQVNLDFLVVPLFIKIDSDNGITYFVSGLEFGIPLTAKVVHDGGDKDISEIIHKIDILASIGIGIHFSIGKPDLSFEFRYYQGLVNLNSGMGEVQSNILFENFKNSGFQIMTGLEWEL